MEFLPANKQTEAYFTEFFKEKGLSEIVTFWKQQVGAAAPGFQPGMSAASGLDTGYSPVVGTLVMRAVYYVRTVITLMTECLAIFWTVIGLGIPLKMLFISTGHQTGDSARG